MITGCKSDSYLIEGIIFANKDAVLKMLTVQSRISGLLDAKSRDIFIYFMNSAKCEL